MEMNKERILYFDYLRVIAMFAVIVLHTSAQNILVVDIGTTDWNYLNFYNCIVRWAVPLFVMISGVFFLDNDRTITIKTIYFKYVKRIAAVFIFWSFLYTVIYYVQYGGTITSLISFFLKGNYHMWFLYMIAGLYIVTPILRRITVHRDTTQYFLLIGGVFAFFIPAINRITVLPETITSIMGTIDIRIATGYAVYFVLGYYLSKVEISKSIYRWIIVALGVVGIIITVGGTIYLSKTTGTLIAELHSAFTFANLATTIAMFVLGKYYLTKISDYGKLSNCLVYLSSISLGVYLIHPMMLVFITEIVGIDTLSLASSISVLVIATMAFILSVLIISLIRTIHPIFKYIV